MNPENYRVLEVGSVADLGEALSECDENYSSEGWWSPHLFEGKRHSENWAGSWCVAVDVDGPTKPDPMPDMDRGLLEAAFKTGAPPGSLFHLTHSGFRVVFAFNRVVKDSKKWLETARACAILVEEWLLQEGLDGYGVDTAVFNLANLNWLPNTTDEKGRSRSADVYAQDRTYQPFVLRRQAKALTPVKPKPKPEVEHDQDLERDRRMCVKALLKLGPDVADERAPWIAVGMVVQSLFGEAGKPLWVAWSQQSEKWNDKDGEKQWRSFGKGSGRGLGSLVVMAKEATGREDWGLASDAWEGGRETVEGLELGDFLPRSRALPLEAPEPDGEYLEHLAQNGHEEAPESPEDPPGTGPAPVAQDVSSSDRPKGYFAADDVAHAVRCIVALNGNWAHVEEQGCWYQWNGLCWDRVSEKVLETWLIHNLKRLAREAWEEYQGWAEIDKGVADVWRTHRRAAGSASCIGRVAKLLRALLYVPLARFVGHANRHLYPCDDGMTWDLSDFTVRPTERSDYRTFHMPFDSKPAECPRWVDFIQWLSAKGAGRVRQEPGDEGVDRDEGVEGFLQRSAGYTLRGPVDGFEKAYIVYAGAGDTGKSTYMKVLADVLEPAGVAALELRHLVGAQTGSSQSTLAQLETAVMAVVDDASTTEHWKHTGLLKTLSSGGSFPIEQKYEASRVTTFYGLLHIAVNATWRPTAAMDEATIRRMRLLPLYNQVDWKGDNPELETPIKDLAEQIVREEAKGVFHWAIEGARDAHLGLTCERIIQSTEAYEAEAEDPLFEAFDVGLHPSLDAESFLGIQDLAQMVKGWAKENEVDLEGVKNVTRMVRGAFNRWLTERRLTNRVKALGKNNKRRGRGDRRQIGFLGPLTYSEEGVKHFNGARWP